MSESGEYIDRININEYTSPVDQAMRTIDIAIHPGFHFEDIQLYQLGEATRLVMEAALESPHKSPEELTEGIREYMGAPRVVRQTRLLLKAKIAKALIERSMLVSDQELTEMEIENIFSEQSKTEKDEG